MPYMLMLVLMSLTVMQLEPDVPGIGKKLLCVPGALCSRSRVYSLEFQRLG